jgi:hypothetical protein
MAHARCKTCGLYHCAHNKGKKKSVSTKKNKFGEYYANSPGLNKLFETEQAMTGEKAAKRAYSHRTRSAPPQDTRNVKEVMDEFSKWLTERGWSVDIAPAINADDRRGFVISILEPTNVKDKEGQTS